MKFVEHSSNMGWRVHEIAWNHHEIEFALPWTHLTKGVSGGGGLTNLWLLEVQHISDV